MIPNYKDIFDLIKKGSTLEAQEKIIELRTAALDLQEENEILRKKIAELENALKLKESIKWKKPSYWLGEDGPFCQRCYDVNNNLVRLQGGKNDSWNCRECKNSYYGPNYVPPQRTRSATWR